MSSGCTRVPEFWSQFRARARPFCRRLSCCLVVRCRVCSHSTTGSRTQTPSGEDDTSCGHTCSLVTAAAVGATEGLYLVVVEHGVVNESVLLTLCWNSLVSNQFGDRAEIDRLQSGLREDKLQRLLSVINTWLKVGTLFHFKVFSLKLE